MTGAEKEPEDDIVLAGEFALGLLDAAARREFEERLGGEPALRALLAEWQERLAGLTDGIAPVAAPAQIRRRLEARLFAPPPRRRFARPRMLWGALAGALAVAVLVVALPFFAPPAPPERAYVAEITNPDSGLAVQAQLHLPEGRLTVLRTRGGPAPGRSLELWVIPAGSQVPVSLGLVDAADIQRTLPPEIAREVATGTLAISDEPEGGSPSGTPTNVLGSGKVALL